FATYLQSPGNQQSVKVKAVIPKSNANLIIGVQTATIGGLDVLQLVLNGDQTAVYPVGSRVQISGSRIFGSRRRPMDRQHVVAFVNFASPSTVVSLLCSDSLLAQEKFCSFGYLLPVQYGLDDVTDVASSDLLIASGHRRGNRPSVQHR